MAQEIPFKILVDTLGAEKTVGELRQEFKDLSTQVDQLKVGTDEYNKTTQRLSAVKEVLKGVQTDMDGIAASTTGAHTAILPLQQEFKELQRIIQTGKSTTGEILSSKDLNDARVRLGEVRGQIREIKNEAINLDPQRRFAAFAQIGSSIASGFAAAQGAVALFGQQNEDLVKILVKVQAATALAQGLQGMANLEREFKILKVVALDALDGIRTGLLATGIGIFLVALGTIIAYWDKIKEAVSGINREQTELLDLQTLIAKQSQEQLDFIEKTDNVSKLMGQTEEQILAAKIKQSEITKLQLLNQLTTMQAVLTSQIEAEKRNKQILDGILKFIAAPITIILGLVDLLGKAVGKNFGLTEKFTDITKLIFDPEATRKKGAEAQKAVQDAIIKISDAESAAMLKQKELRIKSGDEELEAQKTFLQAKETALEETQVRNSEKFIAIVKQLAAKEIQEERNKLNDILTDSTKTASEKLLARAKFAEAEVKIEKDKEDKIEGNRKLVFDDEIKTLEAHKSHLEEMHQNSARVEIQIEDKKLSFVLHNTKATQGELEEAWANYFKNVKAVYDKQIKDTEKFWETIIQIQIDNEAKRAELSDDPIKGPLAAEDAAYAKRLESLSQFSLEQGKLIDDSNEDALIKQRRHLELTNQLDTQQDLLKQEHDKKRTKIILSGEEQRRQLQLSLASQTFGAIGQLAEAFAGKSIAAQRRAFNIQKAAGIAQATIDTYASASAIFKNAALNPISILFPAQPYIEAGLAIISGLARVEKIANTQFNESGAGGTGITGGGSNISIPSPPSAPAPDLSNTTLNTDNEGNFTGFGDHPQPQPHPQPPVRAYVVETDITTTQAIVAGIKKRATF